VGEDPGPGVEAVGDERGAIAEQVDPFESISVMSKPDSRARCCSGPSPSSFRASTRSISPQIGHSMQDRGMTAEQL